MTLQSRQSEHLNGKTLNKPNKSSHKQIDLASLSLQANLKTDSTKQSQKKMINRFRNHSSLFIIIFYNLYAAKSQPNTTGYTCSSNQTTYPCQTYVFYKAMAPNLLDLASIGDLFSVSRLMISRPSNISSPSSSLSPDQSLLIPIQCSCNRVNSSVTISFAGLNYIIRPGDTYYQVSTTLFQNLTTFQSVEVVNPSLVPTSLPIGVNVVFPIFCKCPVSNSTQFNYLISYALQPGDSISSIAARFNTSTQAIIDENGNNSQPFDTIFVPVTNLPQLTQPTSPPVNNSVSETTTNERKAEVIGLSIGLGLCGVLLILVSVLWAYRESSMKKHKDDVERYQFDKEGKGLLKNQEVKIMDNVADYLDKYKVYSIDELRKATDGFDDEFLIEGSVYKASIDDEVFAIKKMKWNAYDELKILQKVNHGNLVKLEGFCIDPEDAICYLVYEYVENGSLYSWLHNSHNKKKLNWKTRLRIAIDVANGLQYIHEHTRPRVVHKDIKSSNILLDSNMRAKISDFGLAKSGCNAITMHIVGTQGYMAPEYLSDGVVSTKMDIFAFGVILLELISGKEAIDEKGHVLWDDAEKIAKYKEDEKIEKLKDWTDGHLFGESCSMESVTNVMAIAVACLQRDPSRRPNMVDIVYALCKSDDFSFDMSHDGLSPRQVLAR